MLTGFILCSLRVVATQKLRYPPNKIAVVGAGIGGTSAAYFLRQKFGKDVQIDIYEKGDVGGRLATIEMEGNQYEAGGAVIHPLNLHMKMFVKELGLSARTPSGDLLGIYNGDEFVFEESEWYIINLIKMLWNYGLNFLRMYMWVEDILDKFMRIYRYQTFDYSFSTTESLLHAMGGDDFITKLNITIDEAMQKSGFTQRFIDDIVGPAMRVNYGQGIEINGFVGAISLAGTDSGLWAVVGGNKLVCNGLIYAAKAQLIKGTVSSVQEKVRSTKSGNTVKLYEVSYATDTGTGLDMYDIVVIATPLNKDIGNIAFVGFDPPIETFSRPYQQTVTTFVHGKLNASFFGCSKASHFPLSEILTTDNPKLFIRSISAVSPTKPVPESHVSKASDLRVWKIFSAEVLTNEQLRQLFESYHAVKVKKWLAYPKYNPPEKLPPIILHRSIYYLNSIEWAASAMEMSAVAAKNVALLSHHQWYEKAEHIDQENLTERLKSEL
ncbi:PREDICTED: prenylcysteine oxidase 1 [Nanorana parkeri]|uniref:prenylcysteine oxidase 1 n=1 Tax=Nanorana parkeri TaxID=125878 RepID=UPI000854E58A|nr:PREDICTED: prenylcysteine oxidase 1 [Nanorana parkeri]